MKKDICKKIEIPLGINVNIDGGLIFVEGPEGKLSKKFDLRKINLRKEGNLIVVEAKKATKKEKRLINTLVSHIKNMISGVMKKFEYKLKICFSHFPISVEIKEKEALIKNFLGEKTPRKVKILEGVEVSVDKEIITIRSPSKELAGQMAADFEMSTRIKSKDRRIFQDGIWIINKAGKDI
ncbi:MAG: 50S ribosomal protein L6 [Candidatus Pacearchaeota archaeon]